MLVLSWSTVNLISLYFTIINLLATNTYEHENRTENPCVGVSSSRVSIPLFHCAQLAIDKFFALRITLIGSLLKAVSKASLCPSPYLIVCILPMIASFLAQPKNIRIGGYKF